jgi:hypothetical protein
MFQRTDLQLWNSKRGIATCVYEQWNAITLQNLGYVTIDDGTKLKSSFKLWFKNLVCYRPTETLTVKLM